MMFSRPVLYLISLLPPCSTAGSTMMIHPRSRLVHWHRQQPFVTGRIALDADDSSTSSTITATPKENANSRRLKNNDSFSSSYCSIDPSTLLNTAELHSAAPLSPKPKKSVRFNEGLNMVHENTRVCREDSQELWYSALECSEFKASTIKHAQEIIRSEKSHSADPLCYHRIMRRTYHACCQRQLVGGGTAEINNNNSNSNDDDDDVLTESEMHNLQQWMASCCEHDRIGMEKLTIRSIAADRRCRRLEAISMIFEIQEMQSSHDRKVEYIRQACQILSRPARRFARQLAQAQYNADVAAL